MSNFLHNDGRYGVLKDFVTKDGIVRAATCKEAETKANSPARGPKFTPSLRSEPAGNRKHPEVAYLGTRDAVRRLNRGVG